MHKVVERTRIVPNIHLLRLEAPEVVRRVVPGNFVIVKIDEVAERTCTPGVATGLAWTAAGGTLDDTGVESPTFTAGPTPGIYDVTLTLPPIPDCAWRWTRRFQPI